MGIPPRFMADPDEVGRRLANKIGSRRTVVTPGLTEALGVLVSRPMPGAMGKFLSERAAEAERANES